jgi:hypothetical protein
VVAEDRCPDGGAAAVDKCLQDLAKRHGAAIAQTTRMDDPGERAR